MSEFLGNLLTEKGAIKAALTQRKKTKIEKTVSTTLKGTKVEITEQLNSKAALEAAEGWTILRKGKKSFRLEKEKPTDEQLEDEMWVLMARMRFDELSDGRDFKISVGEELNGRQIDVFAKDSEVALFVECTQSSERERRDMTALIQKISAIKGKVGNTVRDHYSSSLKLKLGWIIATRNIEWGTADLEKAKAEKITIIRDDEIDYYKRLTDHLGSSAKYQLLSDVFAEEEITGLQLQLPATRGEMGGKTFYNFIVHPRHLIKISHIPHRASRGADAIETYQRMLSKSRLKEIAHYIDNGGQFPTNIVINMKGKNIRFDISEQYGNSAIGTLYLPQCYSSCMIIDGQHRLYGYMKSFRATKESDETTLPVLAYTNLSPFDEARYFIEINCRQVKVTRNIANEVYANIAIDAPKFKDRISAISARVAQAINNRVSSPVYDRFKFTGKDGSDKRCLTLTNFVDGFWDNKLFGLEVAPALLWDAKFKSHDDHIRKAADVIEGYLNMFAKALGEHWNLGDGKGGYLATNLGIRALLEILKELIKYAEYNEGIVSIMTSPADLLHHIEPLVMPIIVFFSNATPSSIQKLRSGSSKSVVHNNALFMMQFINEACPAFKPNGLQDYLDQLDEKGTHEAQHLIQSIETKMYQYIINSLKNIYGEKWWYNGVPEKVRTECVKRQEKEKGSKEKEQYLEFSDYREIAHDNWEYLGKEFSLEPKGGKEKQTNWLFKLTEVRNTTQHSPKWPCKKDQVQFVREIHSKLQDRFETPVRLEK